MAWNICSSRLLVAACPALIRLNDKTKTARTIAPKTFFIRPPCLSATSCAKKPDFAPDLRRTSSQADGTLRHREMCMGATKIEFRLHMVIMILITMLGFWAPWIEIWGLRSEGRRGG